MPDPATVTRALHVGPATLDTLVARLGEPPREALAWALDEALERGWVQSSVASDCGPDGVCSSSAPAVFRLTDRGRALAA